MKTLVQILLMLLAANVASAEEIQKATILVDGVPEQIRFITIDKESYLSWGDILRLLPSVFSLSQKGEIVVNPLVTKPLELPNSMNTQTPSSGTVIESRIDGDFEGWDGETIFKLVNGQIWQQDEYSYTYEYAFSPEVIIYPESGAWKMKVDGVSDSIRVRRLK